MNHVLSAIRSQPEFGLFVGLIQALLAATALIIIGIIVLHTMYILGTHTILYKQRQPVAGWNKRFYPASAGLVLGLLLLMWALNVWQHSRLHS